MNAFPPQASASYDAAGDLTGDGGSDSYQYDAEGRLASINGGSVATLGYNALGQQVQMSTPSTTWSVLFDPTGGWVGRNTSGNWEVGGVFHLGQRQFGMYLDQFYGIHVNALGSTAADTNAAGSEAGAFLFYPWGQTWSSGSGPWQFSAFEYGDPPYLFPTLFRTYYLEFGRWLTPDPTGGDVTDPQSLNRYAYALNNPATFTDPLGLQPGDDPGYGGVDCRSWQYAESHAECQGPGSPWCFESDLYGGPCPTGTLGFPVGGGSYGGGGGGGTATSAPPAGQPPLVGGNALTASIQGEVNFNFFNFINFNFAFGFAIDTRGCVAAIHTKGGLVGSGTRASIGVSVSGSNAETVYDLGGPFSQTTGTVGEVLSGEGGFFFGKSPHGRVVGGSLGATANTPTHLPATVATGATKTQVTPVAVVPVPGGSCVD